MNLPQIFTKPKRFSCLLIALVIAGIAVTACQPKRFYLPVVKSQPGIATAPVITVAPTEELALDATDLPSQPVATSTAPSLMLPMVSKPLPRADFAWQIIPHTIQGTRGNYSLQLVTPQFIGQTGDNLAPVIAQTQLLVNQVTGQFLDNVENAPDSNLPGYSTMVYEVTSNTFWQPNQPIDPYVQLPPAVPGERAVIQGNHNLLSLLFVTDSYYGGAHPFRLHEAVNYDLTAERVLTLQDLFSPGSDYLSILSAYSISELANRPNLPAEMVNAGAAPRSDNFRIWNLTPIGLLITFEEYQVGPYAAGEQHVLIPYGALSAYMDPAGPLGTLE